MRARPAAAEWAVAASTHTHAITTDPLCSTLRASSAAKLTHGAPASQVEGGGQRQREEAVQAAQHGCQEKAGIAHAHARHHAPRLRGAAGEGRRSELQARGR